VPWRSYFWTKFIGLFPTYYLALAFYFPWYIAVRDRSNVIADQVSIVRLWEGRKENTLPSISDVFTVAFLAVPGPVPLSCASRLLPALFATLNAQYTSLWPYLADGVLLLSAEQTWCSTVNNRAVYAGEDKETSHGGYAGRDDGSGAGLWQGSMVTMSSVNVMLIKRLVLRPLNQPLLSRQCTLRACSGTCTPCR
jgi:hypothetical protein